MFLLSVKAGLRAKEIACMTWTMVTDPFGTVCDEIALEDRAAKGDSGRQVPMHKAVRDAMVRLHAMRGCDVKPHTRVIYSERGSGMSAASVVNWLGRLYATLGMHGCSSHSGRRTFVTNAAKKIVEAGGSLRDVQQLAGHRALSTTERYIAGSSDARGA